ncbi:MAG TPA: hypothetical protein VF155_11715 [Candidatus Dormibacteraeota bacterium]
MGSGQGADAAVSAVLRVNGRYATQRTLGATLDAVAAVALAAADGDLTRAQSVRKWQFDRAQRAANMSLPGAESIRQQLGLTWAQVLRIALNPAERRRLALVHDPDWQLGFDGGGQDLAVQALRAVALRVGDGAPLSQVLYDEEARRIEQETRRWRSADPVRMPRSVFILEQFSGAWWAALEAAGLLSTESGESAVTQAKRKRLYEQRYDQLPPVEAILEQALEELGAIPNRAYFERWCRHRGTELPPERTWRFDEVIAALRRSRAERGLATPVAARRSRKLPPLPAGARPQPRRRGVTRGDAMASLRRYAKLYLPANTLPRQKHYMLASSGDALLLASHTLHKFGRFQDLCREAGIA